MAPAAPWMAKSCLKACSRAWRHRWRIVEMHWGPAGRTDPSTSALSVIRSSIPLRHVFADDPHPRHGLYISMLLNFALCPRRWIQECRRERQGSMTRFCPYPLTKLRMVSRRASSWTILAYGRTRDTYAPVFLEDRIDRPRRMAHVILLTMLEEIGKAVRKLRWKPNSAGAGFSIELPATQTNLRPSLLHLPPVFVR